MKHLLISAALLGLAALPLQVSAQTVTTAATSAYPSGYTDAQLQAVLPMLTDLKTLKASYLDSRQGRVVAVGLSAVDRLTLLVRLKQAGIPTGIVDYQTEEQAAATLPPATTNTPTTPSVPAAPSTPALDATTLPSQGAPLAAPHRALLGGPTVIRAGQDNVWSFNLTSTGSQAIRLAHGACDVRFEVIGAAGEIVRPDPKNTLCTMQLVNTDIGSGETKTVQNIHWDGRDASGKNLPAGQYTIRAVFNGAGVHSDVATLSVTVQ